MDRDVLTHGAISGSTDLEQVLADRDTVKTSLPDLVEAARQIDLHIDGTQRDVKRADKR